jgi:hypothetical protein
LNADVIWRYDFDGAAIAIVDAVAELVILGLSYLCNFRISDYLIAAIKIREIRLFKAGCG